MAQRLWLTLIAALVVLASGCRSIAPQQDGAVATTAAPHATTVVAPADEQARPITASEPGAQATPPAERTIAVDARVVPLQSAYVHADVASKVVAILVAEGDTVTQGDVLVRFDTDELAAQVDEAQLTLADAQATYERLRAQPTALELAQARNRVAAANARLQQVESQVTSQDIAAAKAAQAQAQTHLAELQALPDQAEVATAQEALEQAQNNLALQHDGLAAAKANAQAAVETGANALRNTQDAYSRVYWDNQGKGTLSQADRDAEASALRAVDDAQRALDQTTIAYEQAKQAEIAGIAEATDAVQAAERARTAAQAGPTAEALAAANTAIAQANANLEKLVGAQRDADRAAARIAVDDANTSLAQVAAGPDAQQIADAQRQVERAMFRLEQAQQAQSAAVLTAPMAGTVAQMNLALGQTPSVTETAAVVIADFATWQLETHALTEQDISQLQVGTTVIATFDALPGLELPGTVSHIGAIGNTSAGAATYTVVVTLDQTDERLRWNMTASATMVLNAR